VKGLLSDRRIAPLFWTQFLGALNDNLFKNALAILVTYRAMRLGSLGPESLVALSSGLFILPFFLFSATAGQISDKYPKAQILRATKLAEIVIVVAASVALYVGYLPGLLAILFFLGLQAAFFGPAKYSILPELLTPAELVGGNAVIETGTFLAILAGTILGGILIAENATLVLAAVMIVAAIAGAITARAIPMTPGADPGITVSLSPLAPSLETFRATRKVRSVFLSVLGISWFWFMGAALLSVLPAYTRDVLHGSEHVVTAFLAVFCVGIAVGSLASERLGRQRIELGLVPIGSIGMTIGLLDLWWVGSPLLPDAMLGLSEYIRTPFGARVMIDLAIIALASGLYTVPLYAMIQDRSDAATRSRVIAGNNIMNACFMVLSSLLLLGMFAAQATIPTIFLVLAILNTVVALYIYQVIPEFLWRLMVWVLANFLYRLRVTGLDNVPDKGPAILVANHVTFVDWLFIGGACRRPPRFVMYHGYFKMPVVGWMFRDAKVIPIAPAHESEDTMQQAFDRIALELEDGNLVCLFPEGKLTKDGKMNPFRTGIERILARTPVPVVPMALNGLWGSLFSRQKRLFRGFRSEIDLTIAPPISPEGLTAQHLAERVAALGGFEVPPPPQPPGTAPAR